MQGSSNDASKQGFQNPAYSQDEPHKKDMDDPSSKKNKSIFNFSEEENKERGNWSGRLDFILSCIGYAVGLGNVWRFPYLCYRNGGGAFFIPYILSLGLVGIPLFLVELSLGQFTSQGPLTCWQFAPIFKAIGVGMLAVSALLGLYYNTIISWAIWYLFHSFTSHLPWTTCGSWSTPLCQTNLHPVNLTTCTQMPDLAPYPNGTCYNTTSNILYGLYNTTLAKNNKIIVNTAAKEYFDYVGLQVALSKGLDDIGPLRWDMAVCLLIAWIIIFLSLIKGIKSSGKVVYFTAIFPYVVLIILLINGLLQDGHEEGIKFYITPTLDKLYDAGVWKDALVQIFFSLSLCYGGMVAFASYNRFHTDVVRDTMIVCFGNCLTSVFAGFVIFSYIGAFAKANGVSVREVADDGVGLAFIVYPQAVTTLPVPTLWAILFFTMLITLGLDSEFALIETLVTCAVDSIKKLQPYKIVFLAVLCVVFFLVGLVMATPGGAYILQLMDDYSGGWIILTIAILECVALWCYGHRRFARDIETMTGPRVCCCLPWRIIQWWFIICWAFLSPVLLLAVTIFSLVKYEGSNYGAYIFPAWANGIGWVITCGVLISMLATMIYILIVTPGDCSQKIKRCFRPSRFWGPSLVTNRQLVTYVSDFEIDPYTSKNATQSPYRTYEVDGKNYEYPIYDNPSTEMTYF